MTILIGGVTSETSSLEPRSLFGKSCEFACEIRVVLTQTLVLAFDVLFRFCLSYLCPSVHLRHTSFDFDFFSFYIPAWNWY